MAGFTVGTLFTGKVDALKQESIKTKFFILGLPLFPLESWYCVRNTGRGIQGFRIKLNTKSVLITYARWWLGLGAVLLIFLGFAATKYSLLVPGLLGAALAASTIWLGRLSRQERTRRQILMGVVGTGAPPALLPQEAVVKTIARLEEDWKKSSYAAYQENWRNVVSPASVPPDVLPLLFCLAEYSQDGPLAERTRRAIAACLAAPPPR